MVFTMKNWLAIITCASLSMSATTMPVEESPKGLISAKGYFPEPGPEESIIPEDVDEAMMNEDLFNDDEELQENIDNSDEN